MHATPKEWPLVLYCGAAAAVGLHWLHMGEGVVYQRLSLLWVPWGCDCREQRNRLQLGILKFCFEMSSSKLDKRVVDSEICRHAEVMFKKGDRKGIRKERKKKKRKEKKVK